MIELEREFLVHEITDDQHKQVFGWLNYPAGWLARSSFKWLEDGRTALFSASVSDPGSISRVDIFPWSQVNANLPECPGKRIRDSDSGRNEPGNSPNEQAYFKQIVSLLQGKECTLSEWTTLLSTQSPMNGQHILRARLLVELAGQWVEEEWHTPTPLMVSDRIILCIVCFRAEKGRLDQQLSLMQHIAGSLRFHKSIIPQIVSSSPEVDDASAASVAPSDTPTFPILHHPATGNGPLVKPGISMSPPKDIQYVWSNGKGDYQGSNDPSFNPNSFPDSGWTLLPG